MSSLHLEPVIVVIHRLQRTHAFRLPTCVSGDRCKVVPLLARASRSHSQSFASSRYGFCSFRVQTLIDQFKLFQILPKRLRSLHLCQRFCSLHTAFAFVVTSDAESADLRTMRKEGEKRVVREFTSRCKIHLVQIWTCLCETYHCRVGQRRAISRGVITAAEVFELMTEFWAGGNDKIEMAACVSVSKDDPTRREWIEETGDSMTYSLMSKAS